MPELALGFFFPVGSGGGLPGQALPGGPLVPSTGFPPNLPGQALPPEGQPGSPSQPIAPLPAPEPGGPPAVFFVWQGKVYGPVYLPQPK